MRMARCRILNSCGSICLHYIMWKKNNRGQVAKIWKKQEPILLTLPKRWSRNTSKWKSFAQKWIRLNRFVNKMLRPTNTISARFSWPRWRPIYLRTKTRSIGFQFMSVWQGRAMHVETCGPHPAEKVPGGEDQGRKFQTTISLGKLLGEPTWSLMISYWSMGPATEKPYNWRTCS